MVTAVPVRRYDEVTEEFHPYGAEVKFPGDFVGELVPYTVTYSVILITEQALVVGRGGSRGSTMTVVVLSGVVVDVSTAAAVTVSEGGGP